MFIFAVAPLAYLPYLPSYLLWLAAPPVFFNVMYGQTGFLTGGLIGLGLVLLGRRPILAGILVGLASVKPHFGVLIPLALIAGGYWRVFAAVATMAAIVVWAWWRGRQRPDTLGLQAAIVPADCARGAYGLFV
jgi:hypothetical protein